MSLPVSYTPPNLSGPGTRPVLRRQVFYIPGYDPEARTRYRLLFVREFTRYAKRFGLPRREVGRAALDADGGVQSWTVAADPATGGADTAYDVLLWDDVVARDFARSKFASVALLFLGTAHAILAGRLVKFYRLNWKYGNVILYPFVMMLLLIGLAAGLAALVHTQLGSAGPHWPAWVTLPLGLAAGLVLLRAMEALLNRLFFWQLLNDWVFNWQHGQGWRDDYERRVDAFADHVIARVAALRHAAEAGGDVDEILIVGHSSGGLTAVEVAARVLTRDAELGCSGPVLSLATLGSGLPLVALQPRATALRAEIARLVTSRRIVWVDWVAPQDWMNFPSFNPLLHLDLALPPGAAVTNPCVRSSRFRDLIEPETYRRVRFRPFRMHFQYLMANDRPGAYDFFDMVLGPHTLLARAHAAREEPAVACAAVPV